MFKKTLKRSKKVFEKCQVHFETNYWSPITSNFWRGMSGFPSWFPKKSLPAWPPLKTFPYPQTAQLMAPATLQPCRPLFLTPMPWISPPHTHAHMQQAETRWTSCKLDSISVAVRMDTYTLAALRSQKTKEKVHPLTRGALPRLNKRHMIWQKFHH